VINVTPDLIDEEGASARYEHVCVTANVGGQEHIGRSPFRGPGRQRLRIGYIDRSA
jgi:hypothetical protein